MEIREEKYTLDFAKETGEMIHDHIEEINWYSLPPCLDHIVYIRASNRGELALTVAREKGKVVGYLGFWIIKSMMHDCWVGQQAGIFLKKEYRKGRTAIEMIKFAEGLLKEKYDVSAIHLASTVSKDLGPLFKYLKYKETEITYIKEI